MREQDKSLRIGLVHNWPGARNSELDIILRIMPILAHLGHVGIIIDPMGQVLDSSGNRLSPVRRQDDFDLVLNLHYLNPKLLSGLSYAVNWNPLAFIVGDPITQKPLPIKMFNFIVDCFRSHDRVLTAGSPRVDEYVETLRQSIEAQWLVPLKLNLHTTIVSPKEISPITVNVENARVFYIGVNWEKLSTDKDRTIRHEGLFETLDKSGEFVFYGLKEQYGVLLWDGISHYQGELPFDGGDSIIEKSREYGISLVLSSEQHRASGLVSTRIFQACAAGTVIISERNAFIEKHFGDDVYYFDYGDTPQQTAQHIIEAVQECKTDWQHALVKASRCQKRFIDFFALEQEVMTLCEQAQKDISAQDLFITQNSEWQYSVIIDARKLSTEEIEYSLEQIAYQRLKPKFVYLLIDNKAMTLPLYSNVTLLTVNDVKWKGTLGEFLTCQQYLLGNAFLVYSAGFKWSKEHTFQLYEKLAQGEDVAYSPTFVEYEPLLSVHETYEYCIRGLDGGISRIDNMALDRFSVHRFANSNMMISTAILPNVPSVIARLCQFEIAAPWLIMYENWLENRQFPKLCNAITSRWSTESQHTELTYNQYAAADKLTLLHHERNLFVALYGELNPVIQERIPTWEIEQKNTISDSPPEYVISSLQDTVQGLTERLEKWDISCRFSLCLRYQLRNRPKVLKVFEQVHKVLVKILRL
mgnify:CR=1 FL=1|jgi:hypothetical protein